MIEEGQNLSHHETKVGCPAFVIYTVTSLKSGQRQPAFFDPHSPFSTEVNPEGQAPLVKAFLNQQPGSISVLAHYVEIIDAKRQTRWPVLERALKLCSEKGASLLIAELGNLASYPQFSNTILQTTVPFYCCDQPFVDRPILEALQKHAQVQKKLHGDLIKKGLESTSAKSGNPKAAEVISKVNKPKIDAAILFAFFLSPIAKAHQHLSQRQMVNTFNETGFTAPEGGKWVLSQLQKVLERVKLNDFSETLRLNHPELIDLTLSPEAFLEKLRNSQLPALKKGEWTLSQAQKTLQRLKQIDDILKMNTLFNRLLPILRYANAHRLNIQDWPLSRDVENNPNRQSKACDSPVLSV